MSEIVQYAFWGALGWIGFAILGNLLLYLRVKIKSRKSILYQLEETHKVLEEGLKECNKAKRTYENLIAEISATNPGRHLH